MNSNNLGNNDSRGYRNQTNKLRPFGINSPPDSGENGPHDEYQKRLPPDAGPIDPMHLVSASNGSRLCYGIHFLANDEAWHPLPGASLRLRLGAGSGLPSAALFDRLGL